MLLDFDFHYLTPLAKPDGGWSRTRKLWVSLKDAVKDEDIYKTKNGDLVTYNLENSEHSNTFSYEPLSSYITPLQLKK